MMQPIAAGLHRRSGLCHGVDFTGGACDYDLFTGKKYKHIKEEDIDVSDLVVE